jgi:multidrug efflux pump subunit AcrA (membrane-fusion protein)
MLRRLLPILLLALGAGGLAALALTQPQPQPLEAREKAWIVKVASAEPRTLSPILTLYARVDSPRAATLRAPVTADVLEVPALEGAEAAQGSVLVRLDDRDAQFIVSQREADVAEAEAELARELSRHANDRRALEHEKRLLELARREVERAEQLATRDLGSASGLDASRQAEARQALAVDDRRTAIAEHTSRKAALDARLARARALLSRAALDLQRTRVTAPFGARIASVQVAPGDRVRAGDALLTLFDAERLELRTQIPTRYLPVLRESLSARRTIRARAEVDGETVIAVLDRLGAEVTRGRGGTDALFTIEEPSRPTLELGRTLELAVSLPAVEQAISLPAEALYGSNRVYLLEDSRMRGIRVERIGDARGPRGEHRVLVRSPELGAGRQIIVTQLPNAVNGLKVRIAP